MLHIRGPSTTCQPDECWCTAESEADKSGRLYSGSVVYVNYRRYGELVWAGARNQWQSWLHVVFFACDLSIAAARARCSNMWSYRFTRIAGGVLDIFPLGVYSPLPRPDIPTSCHCLNQKCPRVHFLWPDPTNYWQGCICQIFTGGSEFRLAMTDRATIAGMEVAKLVSGV